MPDPGSADSYAYSLVIDRETYDFYIAGFYSTSIAYACYWKNASECITFPTPYAGASLVFTIALSNGRIYCGGYVKNGSNNIPCYWVDGKYIELSYTAADGNVYGMTVYNGSVYLAGRDSSNYTTLWKDSSLVWSDTLLADGYGHGVTVYDKDIYLAGYSIVGGINTPYIYKNGVRATLPYSTQGQAYSVEVKPKR